MFVSCNIRRHLLVYLIELLNKRCFPPKDFYHLFLGLHLQFSLGFILMQIYIIFNLAPVAKTFCNIHKNVTLYKLSGKIM